MDVERSWLIDALPGLVWTAQPDGSAEYVNLRWREYTGLSLEEALGSGWHSVIFPGDLEFILDRWSAMLEGGKPVDAEARLRRHDGEYRRFLLRAAPIRDETGNIVRWCGISTDIEDWASVEAAHALKQLTEAQHLSATGSFTADIWAENHHWSEELYRIFEFEPGTKISVDIVRTKIHPDDLPAFDASFQKALEEGSDYDHFFRIVLAGGAIRHLHAVAHFTEGFGDRPLFVGAIRDVTESKLAEDALRASEAELRRTLRHLTIAQEVSATGSFTADVIGDHHTWSDELYRVFDFDPASPPNLARVRDVVHPDDAKVLETAIEQAMSGRDIDFIFRVFASDGALKHLRGIGRISDYVEDRPVLIGAVQDITKNKAVEDALNRARSELAHVSRITAMSAVTASIAHEVNQPLAGIITNASTCLRMLAADIPNIEGARATAQRTIRDGNRASDVIKRLRALFARKEAAIEPVDLNDAVQEVLTLSSTELQKNRVIVATNLESNLPEIRGDRVQLQQVIMNLILNAADAMAEVDVGTRHLMASTAVDGDKIIMSVRDTGKGVDPEHFERLFDAFFTTKETGMGIGLSISRSIIEGHGGQLWATANDDRGTTFSFSLPVFVADAATDPKMESSVPSRGQSGLERGLHDG